MKIDHSVLRFLSLIIGGLSIFLGYLLFVKGVTGDATLVVGAKTLNGQLLNAAPGLFFAISGVLIVIVSLYRKIEERHYAPRVQEAQFETGLGEIQKAIEQLGEDIRITLCSVALSDGKSCEIEDNIPTYLRQQNIILSSQIEALKKEVSALAIKGKSNHDNTGDFDTPSFIRKSCD